MSEVQQFQSIIDNFSRCTKKADNFTQKITSTSHVKLCESVASSSNQCQCVTANVPRSLSAIADLKEGPNLLGHRKTPASLKYLWKSQVACCFDTW